MADTKYRTLEVGEIKLEGDKFFYGGAWLPTVEVGQEVFDFQRNAYRRALPEEPAAQPAAKPFTVQGFILASSGINAVGRAMMDEKFYDTKEEALADNTRPGYDPYLLTITAQKA